VRVIFSTTTVMIARTQIMLLSHGGLSIRYQCSVVCSASVSTRSKTASPSSTSARVIFSAGIIRTTDRPQLNTKGLCSKALDSAALHKSVAGSFVT
jgi:hypothetical protein